MFIRIVTSPLYFFFFFHDTATTEIYTLSLHDALPISRRARGSRGAGSRGCRRRRAAGAGRRAPGATGSRAGRRSEEHTSELQSHVNLVCRLLLEKKKKTQQTRMEACTHKYCALAA